MLKFIHAADFHLDSAFGALTPQQSAARRRESRELVARLSNYVNQNGVQLVLLAGDLFDSASVFRETRERLAQALGQMEAQVFIAPGNHDWYGPAWQAVAWPENVHIFKTSAVESVKLPQWNLTVHGAAFTGAEQGRSFLADFTAPADGGIHIGVFHGELDAAEPRYNSIDRREVAASGLAYLALGHIHKRTEPLRFGGTLCAWPGCPEGRGFDELGEKGFYEGIITDGGSVSVTFVPFARRRCEVLRVDVTGKEPRAAIEAALPEGTEQHLYRILLTGETDEGGVNMAALQSALADRFFALEVRDHTRMAEDIWARAGEDSLRGEFLRRLYARLQAAQTEEEKDAVNRAARFGLAALDHRDLE